MEFPDVGDPPACPLGLGVEGGAGVAEGVGLGSGVGAFLGVEEARVFDGVAGEEGGGEGGGIGVVAEGVGGVEVAVEPVAGVFMRQKTHVDPAGASGGEGESANDQRNSRVSSHGVHPRKRSPDGYSSRGS